MKELKGKSRRHGRITTKMMSFRLDTELEDWLNEHPNKGRYINDLIRKDQEAREGNQ